MNPRQYPKIIELSQTSDNENYDTRGEIRQHELCPTCVEASSSMLADKEETLRHGTHNEGDAEIALHINLAIPNEDAKVFVPSTVDDGAACRARVVPETAFSQNLLLKGKTSYDPIVLDDEDGDAESVRRISCHSISSVIEHSSSNGVGRTLSTPSGERMSQKRKKVPTKRKRIRHVVARPIAGHRDDIRPKGNVQLLFSVRHGFQITRI